MKSSIGGCAVIVAGVLIAIALWWLFSTYIGPGDDGPTGHTITTWSNA